MGITIRNIQGCWIQHVTSQLRNVTEHSCDPTAGWSIAAWVNPVVAETAAYLVSLANNANIGPNIRIDQAAISFPRMLSLTLREPLAGGPQTIGNLFGPNSGTWMHIGCSCSAVDTAATFRRYKNGVALGNQALTLRDALPSTANIIVGSATGGGNPLAGGICEVLIFNSVLTDAEFAAIHQFGWNGLSAARKSECFAYYRLDEMVAGTGAYVLDYSGKGRHLTPTSTPQYSIQHPFSGEIAPTNRFAYRSGAGVNAYAKSRAADIPRLNSLLTGLTGLTVAGWYKDTIASPGNWISGLTDNASTTIAAIDYNTNLPRVVARSEVADTAYLQTPTALKTPVAPYDRSWHLLVGTMNYVNKTMALYIDGSLVALKTNATFSRNSLLCVAAEYTIGARLDVTEVGNRYNGAQWLIPGELTREQILHLYIHGKSPITPIAEYLLQTNTGATFVDSSGNGFDLDLQNYNANQWVPFS